MSAPTLEKILQAVNEKYGTSFEGWSQLPTAYEVGDTVPNWNAYEKIEMEQIKVAINTGTANLNIFGKIKGSVYIVSINSSNFCNVCTNEGVIQYPALYLMKTLRTWLGSN